MSNPFKLLGAFMNSVANNFNFILTMKASYEAKSCCVMSLGKAVMTISANKTLSFYFLSLNSDTLAHGINLCLAVEQDFYLIGQYDVGNTRCALKMLALLLTINTTSDSPLLWFVHIITSFL